MELVGMLWDAATCLFRCGKVHAAYVYKLEENLTSLQMKFDALQNLSRDVQIRIDEAEATSERLRTNEVNGWLQRIHHLQEEMMEINTVHQEISNNKCLSGCCPKNCVLSYKSGKRIVHMLKNVNELLTRGEHFGSVDIAYKLPPKPVIEMPSVETVGLDLMLNQVWNSIEDENIGIIGLYGMGGAGKTTLMRRIHNEFGKRNLHFDIVLWVVVSRDFDINRIMNDIRNRLQIDDNFWNKSSQDQRVAKIYQVLKHKKFVFMVDDLWKSLELEMVGVPLPKETNNQSKVLFTTRFEDVCAKLQAEKKLKVECLSEQEAFQLFCKKVGEDTWKCHGEIEKLAWEMAKECGGLPLALITVGSAMAGVKGVEAWRQATSDLRSSCWVGPVLEEKVFRVLKFSYDKLPDETHRKCFLYCALYPEDFKIKVDGLIYRWIGEGFLDEDKTKKNIYDMHVQGKSIVEKLKLSCLLEGVVEYDFSDVPSIKMHDVIRDMALWLFRDQDVNKDRVIVEGEALAIESETNVERLNAVERISIINAGGSWRVPLCPNLITICIRKNINQYSNLQFMSKLKVLDLSRIGIEHLPSEIGKLINLEFLDLSETSIQKRFPTDLKNLENLRVLLMEKVGFDLQIIPMEVIESLVRLRVFRFVYIGKLKYFEGERTFLEKLESLPKLEELCIHLSTLAGMQKLLHSTKLRDCSTLCYLNGIEDQLEMASILESLSAMKNLKYLSFFQVNIVEDSSISGPCRLHNLRRVIISRCNSITHLTWLRYAPLLEFLLVGNCDSIEEVVKEDGRADREEADNHIFSNLTHLRLYGLPKLESIYKRALAFPLLKFIKVDYCPKLRKLPLKSNSAKDTLITIRGEYYWWNNLEWEDRALKDQFQSNFLCY
ncbi:probable disease resistance protein At1g61300 [Abrus precatorius]|uniref:Probable disease resistance protein At1g61300 n=1 Tax=Abrus precatorius TaxID=3816 RepID=A0A8B8KML7_ABRPR|nr:probable disease resistance protein At1g61300 [Abrus precatorius]XP_027345072.1 probable disease resistance protein At1g61300 [Abrus precatorius]